MNKTRLTLNILSILFLILILVVGYYLEDNPFFATYILMMFGLFFLISWIIVIIFVIIHVIIGLKKRNLRALIPLGINIISILVIIMVDSITSKQYLTDSDIVVHNKMYSPNNEYLLICYAYDIGALGFTKSMYSVVSVNDTSKDLSRHRLPQEYKKAKWLNNDTITVEYDIRRNIALNEKVKKKKTFINGKYILVKELDFKTDAPLFVEHRALSPYDNKELIAYRYRNELAKGILHVSVIEKGSDIPEIGNIYIGNQHDDYIYFGEWSNKNEITLFTEHSYFAKPYILEHNGIKVNLVEEEYPISSVEPGWYHKERYSPKNYLDNELSLKSFETKAIIINKFYYADGRSRDIQDILYQYSYQGHNYTSILRVPEKSEFRINDSLDIIISTSTPDIHLIKNEQSFGVSQ